MMTRAIVCSSLVIFLFLSSGISLHAHERFRIVGTITKLSDRELSVTNKDRKTFVIALRKDTYVWRDKKKVPASELKTGLSVVVDALGDSEQELEASDIRIILN